MLPCANLGVDCDSDDQLNGLWSTVKRVSSRATSGVISIAKDSGIPGVSQLASTARSTGQQLEEGGLIPSFLRTGSAGSGGGSSALAAAPAASAATGDNTLFYLGGAALVAFLLLRRK